MRFVHGLLLTAATAAAATTTAHADTNRDELWFGGGTRALRSPSANALTDDNLAGASLGYARDLGVGVASLPGLAVWAEAGMTTDSAKGTMFQTMATDLSALGFTGGVRLRYLLHRLIAASVRAELGAQRVDLGITDHGSSASDHAWGTIGSAGVALDMFALARPPFGIGVRAELGYVMAQAIALTPHGQAGGDALRLPMTALPLGSLDLSGPTFAVSLVGQF
jgi:hypothetical protein